MPKKKRSQTQPQTQFPASSVRPALVSDSDSISDSDSAAALGRIAHLLESVIAPDNAAALARGTLWRWEKTPFGGGRLHPAPKPTFPALSQLQGLDDQIDMLSRNLRQFLRGMPANHVLLTGPRGCGKSTVARGVFGKFQRQGLRVVESSPQALALLPQLAALLAQRPEKFIVFCDDLSFAENNHVFNRMKSALEGAMTAANNLLVCATSNRRYMTPEYFSENAAARMGENNELHPDESSEEKTALFDRFGLWLPVFAPNWEEYDAIARRHLELAGVRPTSALLREARQWAETRGAHNGRAARQFAAAAAGRKIKT